MSPTKTWQHAVAERFEQRPERVFTRQQLAAILEQHREAGEVPPSLTLRRFVDTFEKSGQLRDVMIISETDALRRQRSPQPTDGTPDEEWEGYRPYRRFTWGPNASPYEVALSLRPRSYISHASAVFLHGLTHQIVRTVYANAEQAEKPSATPGTLAQERIDAAFRRPPRMSQFVFVYEGTRLILVNGKQTGNLEVADIIGPDSHAYPATNIERTLIDVVVRPAYGGGVFEILEAFRGAKDRVSIGTLLSTLRRLKYVYPYHQALGFYMERAGYPASALERVTAFGASFDFYLTHQIPSPQYDSRWRIYYPEGL